MTKKKKGIILGVIAAVLVVAIVLPILIINVRNKKVSWKGLSIANFEKFSAIGAANIDGEKQKATAYGVGSEIGNVADKNKKNNATHLVGFKKDGSCEKIKFENNKGKFFNEDVYLTHFDSYKYFSIASFSKDKKSEYIDFDDYCYSSIQLEEGGDYSVFINNGKDGEDYQMINIYSAVAYGSYSLMLINNQNGKIYDFKDILKSIAGERKTIGLEYISINEKRLTYDYDYILFSASTSGCAINERELYQLSFEGENIKIVQRMDISQYENFVESIKKGDSSYSYKFFSDKFGNVFYNTVNWDITSNLLYQKTDGTFGEIGDTKELVLSPNGIVYRIESVGDGNADKIYYLNAEGNFIECGSNDIDLLTSIGISETALMNIYLYFNGGTSYVSKFLYRENNVIYFAYSQRYVNPLKFGLVKMIIDDTDDWKYKIEFVDYNSVSCDPMGQVAASNGYVYSLDTDGKLKMFNMSTGESTIFESQYMFNDLKFNKHLNMITFIAIDKTTMNEVDGYFDENNEIILGDFKDVKRGLNKVYVVRPIN